MQAKLNIPEEVINRIRCELEVENQQREAKINELQMKLQEAICNTLDLAQFKEQATSINEKFLHE